MSVATTELSRSTQHLIDSRLDTIDRMLLGRVSRQERIEIVREVEAQIFEQLHERGADEFSRDDVLAVLGRLDPPEAYLPEVEGDAGPVPVRTRLSPAPRAGHTQPVRRGDPRIAKVSGILGLVSLACLMLVPLSYIIAALLNEEIIFYVLGGAALVLPLIASVLGIVLAIYSRMSSVWAVIGVTTAALSIFGSFSLVILVVLLG
jgi:hypothetical protein